MGKNRFRKLEVQRHQHRGPIDRVGREDVLADEMHISGPESIDGRFGLQVLERGDVIHERIEPDVGHVVLIERQLDAPGEPGFWS